MLRYILTCFVCFGLGAVILLTIQNFIDEAEYRVNQPINLSVQGYREVNDKVRQMAQMKMDNLVETGYFSHDNDDGCDVECRQMRVDLQGYVTYENLYHGPCDVPYAYRRWKTSKWHKFVLDVDADFQQTLISEPDSDSFCYIVLVKAKYGVKI